MKNLKRMAVAAVVMVACGFGGMTAASACGPYGDPGMMMQMDVENAKYWLEVSLKKFDEVARAGDTAAMKQAVENVATASAHHKVTLERLAAFHKAQQEAKLAVTTAR